MNFNFLMGQKHKRLKGLLWKIVILLIFPVATAQIVPNSKNGFKPRNSKDGKYITHPYIDNEDPLSDSNIVEFRDANNISRYFTRRIRKPVCLSQVCQPISLYIVWDGSGNFQKLKLIKNKPLSKTDHTEFTQKEYLKLNSILSDEHSILKNLQKEDLILEDNRNLLEKGIDAYSGATKPSLYEYVVRDAVYTCYTLWHTVYGPTRQRILQILDEKADSEYLRTIFNEQDIDYTFWGIDFLERHPKYQNGFYKEVAQYINSKNDELSQKALDYFSPNRLTELEVQKYLVTKCKKEKQLDIIWKLASIENLDSSVILILLEKYNVGGIDVTDLGYVYKMMTKEHLANDKINLIMRNILNDDNRYVRNITMECLDKIPEK
ncbi:hypothetical protein HPE56_08620 [Maribacter sp. ANRC-HE7]|uniref:HEAT repeat-containing protein n=1 Tax=Maribacter aquimaris TaxID=2737171 RepID=A0ABR7UZ21_9FLAO|nr:hypothetical protein [Maribacter aquimaris]MBD0777855.1 hypothetical protein [Maribacter aquimaris]